MDYSGGIFNVEEIELVFPKFNNEAKMTESEICMKCHGCCTYVAVPLEYPRSKDTLDTYVWYLLHRNVEIEIDNYNKWFLIFKTPCDKLLPNGACSIYETRPEICRDYSADNCSRTAKDHAHQFKQPSELLQYLEQKKKAKSGTVKPASASRRIAGKKSVRMTGKKSALRK
ncbi:MAG TPA: YkgJ family cysteine cluster protein [Leptospiraceae bacterium]|jgi:Fe-S-cluster containining protein|nr:YkgJ family cysteine cluster protein [Leptospirales bacterium]HMU84876.1 YkgJ family cysteine cluster protein [Leptospiraceae bacterium]HMW58780.1 YkgJ family cysteine cluster protein [Leptospiraceae bacterium]HMX55724.1 YkgJ family cysteine cluster protein [Leptospiraceae bacterium]HMY44260.1 YkgJ family cysteine cluster protein [Leptospiraceae bacterium]